MNTRANSAADQNLAKAVKSAASAAATVNQAPKDAAETVPATVLWRLRINEQITSVEIDGRVFKPARDQAEERRAARLEQIGRTLDAMVGEAGAPLLGELDVIWQSRIGDQQDALLREVGYLLVDNGHADLWRLVYTRLSPNGDKNHLDAPAEFLHDRGSGY